MNRWILLLLLAAPLPALAGECDHWKAEMMEEEEGTVMSAYICVPRGDATIELYVRCAGPNDLMLRYIPIVPTDYPPKAGMYTTELEFNFDQEMFTRPAQYEEMDGALVTETAIDAPFVYVLQAQKQMTIIDVNDKIPSATFTLEGAKAALTKVIAACRKP
ncbi:MAG: hypothetical protein JWM58_960 [Rhizobium sp.]|jgi:hypothetical protein|nr:hypothetical protein [Rhizobium sp.]